MGDINAQIELLLELLYTNRQLSDDSMAISFKTALLDLYDLVANDLTQVHNPENFIIKTLLIYDDQNVTSEMVATLVEILVNPFLTDLVLSIDNMIGCFIKVAQNFDKKAKQWIFETHSTVILTATNMRIDQSDFMKIIMKHKDSDLKAFKSNLIGFGEGIKDQQVVQTINNWINWINLYLLEAKS